MYILEFQVDISCLIVANLRSMSQANVEKKLDRYLQEVTEGKREGSLISAQTADTLSVNDQQLWCTIRKELEDIGITVAAFDANKDFIFEWFKNMIAKGAFEERKPYEDSLDERLPKGKFNNITCQLGSQ